MAAKQVKSTKTVKETKVKTSLMKDPSDTLLGKIIIGIIIFGSIGGILIGAILAIVSYFTK